MKIKRNIKDDQIKNIIEHLQDQNLFDSPVFKGLTPKNLEKIKEFLKKENIPIDRVASHFANIGYDVCVNNLSIYFDILDYEED